jgi:hypothetical protein
MAASVRTIAPKCPNCKQDRFELRLLKDDGVAAARCLACERHFLLLDSADYWFDVIQSGYPKLTTCTCKGTSFRLLLDYRLREDGDVEHVALTTHCTGCRKSQRRMSVEIDYSPTKRLLTQPLVPCQNPDIRYDLRELSLYAAAADIARIVKYLGEQGCSFSGSIREQNDWVLRRLTTDQAVEIVARKVSYLPHYSALYTHLGRLAITDADVSTFKKETAFWKRNEVIRCSSAGSVQFGSRTGQHYDIQFGNEFIHGQKVEAKSPRFRKLTAALLDWLGKQFVTWRGAQCFDNEKVHRRLFGKEYQSRRKPS